MVKKTSPLILQLDDHDVACDFLDSTHGCSDELHKLISAFDKDLMDCDYNVFLSSLLDLDKSRVSNGKKREKDDEGDHSFSHEEVNDPTYEHFIEYLKEHGNSYMLEYEENGSRVVVKYEGDSSSDGECDLESRRRRKSAMKQKDGPSSPMPHVENQGMLNSQSTPRRAAWNQTRNKPKCEKEENAELLTKKTVLHSSYPRSKLTLKVDSSLDEDCVLPKITLRSATKPKNEHFNQMHDVFNDDSRSTPPKKRKKSSGRSSRNKSKSEMEEDTDYHSFLQNFKFVKDNWVCKKGGDEVVYGLRNGEGIRKKEEHDYESYSDVEILDIDSTALNKANARNIQSEFRHKVIDVLRKPYNANEYKKLRDDIKLRKPVERHIELRSGKIIPYQKQEDGKSYLDHYPDLKNKYYEVKDNRPKKLNLLRGFFLWLQHPNVFQPWLDKECLAICPWFD